MPRAVAWDRSLREPRKTAQVHYNARGWSTVNNVGVTSPGEHPSWGQYPAAAGWLCQHLWEHYAFTGDRKFLKWAYPILKESAEFYLDFLVEEPRRKWLVTAPSNSPENSFKTADGQVANVCYGPSMDQQIIHDLFTHCIEASKVLGADATFRAELEREKARLAPPQIGKHGQLQEWLEDFDERARPPPVALVAPHRAIRSRCVARRRCEGRASRWRRLGGGGRWWSRAWISTSGRLRTAIKAHEVSSRC